MRKRKEEIHEQNGHKFIQKQFYTVVLCALCGEFLLKGAGMQCEDCKYACHKNCYQKVVTKCISKSNAESVSPFRLVGAGVELTTDAGQGRGADQPSHPASLRAHHQHLPQLVLPLRHGPSSRPQERSQVLRCVLLTVSQESLADPVRASTECGITCHADCVHLVPYFCGMSMEMANKLLSDIKTINSNRRPPATIRPAKPAPQIGRAHV